ncbi:hypothetical protein DITRI_Ditri20bG0016700 [Diplodiscus trichospermus]
MFSRGSVGYLLLILLIISALHHEVLAARFLTEKLEDEDMAQRNWKGNPGSGTDDGYFATIDRQVPSSPDPLHNRFAVRDSGQWKKFASDLYSADILCSLFEGSKKM